MSDTQLKLGVVIPVLNDNEEIVETVKSIRATSPEAEVEVIVIDDQSTIPVSSIPGAIVRRTDRRIGPGAARHMGVEMAQAPYILLLDSHMRFEPGWYEKAMSRIVGRPKTMHNAACLGLDANCMDLAKHKGAYLGADLVFEDSQHRIFEGVWTNDKGGDDYELSCVMGANYFIPRDFFLHIGGLAGNRMWGSEEPFLSLKVWLAGGEIRLMREVRIGHKFRNTAPYATPVLFMSYNKLRFMYITLPPALFEYLAKKLEGQDGYWEAQAQFEKDKAEIEAERADFQRKAIRSVEWLCEKFNINNPLNPKPTPPPKLSAGQLTAIYQARKNTPSDISEHMEFLSRLASTCESVTEFGVRGGNSTIALLHGRPAKMVSYDINDFAHADEFTQAAGACGVSFEFRKANVTRMVPITETDLLFIDTLHTGPQVAAELARHAVAARKYIAFHDTTTFGDNGEGGGEGLWPAIARFLRAHPEWELWQYHTHNNGLTVLRRK